MAREYFVAMTIRGEVVASSAVANGTYAKCREVRSRLLGLESHPTVGWVILPCAETILTSAPEI